jgi:hypothetical protein
MLACAIAIALQGDLKVSRFLAAELRDTVRRVGIAVALDAMASKTGISDFFACCGIALSEGRLGKKCGCEKQHRGTNDDLHVRNHLIFRLFQTPARDRASNEPAMVVTLGADF